MNPKRREKNTEVDFQMAPMIDMVFLLLVFFMCVSSLSQAENNIKINLPESAFSNTEEKKAQALTISLMKGVYLGKTPISFQELRNAFEKQTTINKHSTICIRAGKEVEYASIKKILKLCEKFNFSDILYSTYEKK